MSTKSKKSAADVKPAKGSKAKAKPVSSDDEEEVVAKPAKGSKRKAEPVASDEEEEEEVVDKPAKKTAAKLAVSNAEKKTRGAKSGPPKLTSKTILSKRQVLAIDSKGRKYYPHTGVTSNFFNGLIEKYDDEDSETQPTILWCTWDTQEVPDKSHTLEFPGIDGGKSTKVSLAITSASYGEKSTMVKSGWVLARLPRSLLKSFQARRLANIESDKKNRLKERKSATLDKLRRAAEKANRALATAVAISEGKPAPVYPKLGPFGRPAKVSKSDDDDESEKSDDCDEGDDDESEKKTEKKPKKASKVTKVDKVEKSESSSSSSSSSADLATATATATASSLSSTPAPAPVPVPVDSIPVAPAEVVIGVIEAPVSVVDAPIVPVEVSPVESQTIVPETIVQETIVSTSTSVDEAAAPMDQSTTA